MKKPTPPPDLLLCLPSHEYLYIDIMSFGIVLSILDSLIARTSILLLLITILNSSICLGRLAIFKLAILKPPILGISRS